MKREDRRAKRGSKGETKEECEEVNRERPKQGRSRDSEH